MTMREQQVMMLAGPVPVSEAVAEAASMTTRQCFHRMPSIYTQLEETKMWIRRLLGFSDEFEILIFFGTGRYGIESVIRGLSREDSLFVANNGRWGEYMKNCLTNHNKSFYADYNPQQPLSVEAVRTDLLATKAKRLAFVAHDTDMGISNPTVELLDMAWKNNTTAIVDAMSSIVVENIPWSHPAIDAVCFSSSKALRGPNGLAIVAIRKRCCDECKPSKEGGILDLGLHVQNMKTEWGYPNGQLPPFLLNGLYVALDELRQEGGAITRRQEILDRLEYLRGKLCFPSSQFSLAVSWSSPYVLCVRLPAPWTWRSFSHALYERNCSVSVGYEHEDGGVINISPAGEITYAQMDYFIAQCFEIIDTLKWITLLLSVLK